MADTAPSKEFLKRFASSKGKDKKDNKKPKGSMFKNFSKK